MNKVKLFQKHVVEGKTIRQAAKEIGVSERMCRNYQNSDDYRELAMQYLEDSSLRGLQGTVGKLVSAMDATKPIVTQAADGTTHITHVPDPKTRLEALKEVLKIYGVYAPERKDTSVTISFSSDEDLFRKIDEAARNCRYVESVQRGEGSYEMAEGQPSAGSGTIVSRQRTLLQLAPVSESQ